MSGPVKRGGEEAIRVAYAAFVQKAQSSSGVSVIVKIGQEASKNAHKECAAKPLAGKKVSIKTPSTPARVSP